MHITTNDAQALTFKTYRKTTLTQAYQSTEADHTERVGIIETLEGPVTFDPGDWICTGAKNEKWPVPAKEFPEIYEEARRDGNSVLYRSRGTREATQITEPFTVTLSTGNILHGNPGDYLVRRGDKLHIVDKDIFEGTHELMEVLFVAYNFVFQTHNFSLDCC